ncbi:MAG: TIGR04076 family protein, partial [Bdellovibrionota bacterium]
PAALECAVDKRTSFKCKSPTDASVYVIRATGAGTAPTDVCAELRHDSVDACEILGPCRYNAKPAKGIKAGPVGLCQDAHHAIYPYGLARMYGADFGNGVDSDVSINCPGTASEVVFRIRRTTALPRLLGALCSVAAKAFGRIFHPVDLKEYRVSYIVERVAGKCPAVHAKGDRFEFNVKRRKELCPASFNALYPYIFLKKRGQVFDWAGSGDVGVSVPCPDCMGAVYEL